MRRVEVSIVGVLGTMGSALLQRCESVGQSALGLSRETALYQESIVHSDILLLCMKQKDTVEWLAHYGESLRDGQVVLSLAALLSIDTLKHHCNNDGIRIGRFMTTTGIANGAQEIVWTSDGLFDQHQLQRVHTFLSRLGETKYLGVAQDEALEHRTFRACVVGWIADACAQHVSALIQILGFTPEEAQEAVDNALSVLVTQRSDGLEYITCRDRVMSEGGITEAGIKTRFQQVYNGIEAGLRAALSRASEISAQFKE